MPTCCTRVCAGLRRRARVRRRATVARQVSVLAASRRHTCRPGSQFVPGDRGRGEAIHRCNNPIGEVWLSRRSAATADRFHRAPLTGVRSRPPTRRCTTRRARPTCRGRRGRLPGGGATGAPIASRGRPARPRTGRRRRPRRAGQRCPASAEFPLHNEMRDLARELFGVRLDHPQPGRRATSRLTSTPYRNPVCRVNVTRTP